MDDNETKESNWFYLLSGLAVLFFVVAFVGLTLLVGIFIWPHSGLANSLLEILSVGQDSESTVGMTSVIDLLIGIVGATGSLSLSLALAAIYVSQNRILSGQKEIQEDQANIMRRQKLPEIAAHESGICFHDGAPSLEKVGNDGKLDIRTTGSGPYVSVTVRNHGDETAEQVQLACLIEIQSVDKPQLYSGVAELTADSMFTKPPRGEGALLPPTEKLELLYGTPALSSSPETVSEPMRFINGIKKQAKALKDEETASSEADSPVGTIRFGFVLIFTNSVNERFHIPIENAYSLDTDVLGEDENMTLNSLKERAVVYDIEDLIKDLDWSIPEEAFAERDLSK